MTPRSVLFVFDSALVNQPPSLDAAIWSIHVVHSVAHGRQAARSHRFKVGLVCIDCAAPSLMGQVRDLITSNPQMEWIALVPKELLLVRDVAQVICTGFYDYHTLPADPERLMTVLGRAYGMVSLRIGETNGGATARTVDFELVGASEKIQGVRRTIRKLAHTEAPILISGESGTGKELAARALHRQSRRGSGPFVAVNCGALPRALIQSELFGHEKGAFTGAHARNIGHIEASGGGTIFLDEVADLSLDLQVNLLRFLQEGTIERLAVRARSKLILASSPPATPSSRMRWRTINFVLTSSTA